MFNTSKLFLAGGLLALAGMANASYEVKLTDKDTITFGGFIKIDTRYVDGDIGYKDFWIGSGAVLPEDKQQIRMFANETRFNMKYVHGDVTGFIEMDFYGGGGNEIISNSRHPRLRHAFIKYNDFLVGQTWSTFMNTSALAETADFAGPMAGEVFVRNNQIRYTTGAWSLAIENPESYGGDPSADKIPDAIVKYTVKGDWGNVSFSGLARQLNTAPEFGGETESAFGASIAGRIKTFGKDDFRFQVHGGETGRYVGVTAQKDLVGDTVESSISGMVAYRHFWTESVRSSVFYGFTDADESNSTRYQYGANLFKNYTKALSVGVELGSFNMDKDDVGITKDVSSMYGQLSVKYVL